MIQAQLVGQVAPVHRLHKLVVATEVASTLKVFNITLVGALVYSFEVAESTIDAINTTTERRQMLKQASFGMGSEPRSGKTGTGQCHLENVVPVEILLRSTVTDNVLVVVRAKKFVKAKEVELKRKFKEPHGRFGCLESIAIHLGANDLLHFVHVAVPEGAFRAVGAWPFFNKREPSEVGNNTLHTDGCSGGAIRFKTLATVDEVVRRLVDSLQHPAIVAAHSKVKDRCQTIVGVDTAPFVLLVHPSFEGLDNPGIRQLNRSRHPIFWPCWQYGKALSTDSSYKRYCQRESKKGSLHRFTTTDQVKREHCEMHSAGQGKISRPAT